jgi:hypothetical protein
MRVGAEGGGASPWSAEGALTLTGALGMISARGVGGGREHALEADPMEPRTGNQRGESLHELPGWHHDRGRALSVGCLQGEHPLPGTAVL